MKKLSVFLIGMLVFLSITSYAFQFGSETTEVEAKFNLTALEKTRITSMTSLPSHGIYRVIIQPNIEIAEHLLDYCSLETMLTINGDLNCGLNILIKN